VKKSSPTEYPLYDDLVEGSAAAKRVTDKINEAQRRAENIQTVQTLQTRVEDWKGHHLGNFGDLLLDDIFLVTKSEVDREYHVFLFEKIILCCKEAVVIPSKKVSKNNSILKKQSVPPTPVPGGSGLSKKKNTPLLLKGRIFLNNVTSARRVPIVGGMSQFTIHDFMTETATMLV
jgi:cell division control protein 24